MAGEEEEEEMIARERGKRKMRDLSCGLLIDFLTFELLSAGSSFSQPPNLSAC